MKYQHEIIIITNIIIFNNRYLPMSENEALNIRSCEMLNEIKWNTEQIKHCANLQKETGSPFNGFWFKPFHCYDNDDYNEYNQQCDDDNSNDKTNNFPSSDLFGYDGFAAWCYYLWLRCCSCLGDRDGVGGGRLGFNYLKTVWFVQSVKRSIAVLVEAKTG